MTISSSRILPRFAGLALALSFPIAAQAASDSAHPQSSTLRTTAQPTGTVVPKTSTLPVAPALTASKAAAAIPAPGTAEAIRTTVQAAPGGTATPRPDSVHPTSPAQTVPTLQQTGQDVLRDSAKAPVYKVAPRGFDRQRAMLFLKTFSLRPKSAKPDSTPVNWVFRGERGDFLAFERGISEFSYGNDSVAFLGPKDHVPDSLIRRRTDAMLKGILGEQSLHYAFVNYEVTLVQRRQEGQKEPSAPVPAYYIGRYVRKLGGRHVLGDGFQVRLSYGAGGALNYLSYRDPVLVDSSVWVKVPTRAMVEEYLAKWSREPRRLGRQIFPYHPDNLRIRALKPVKVFESYVQVPEKDGLRLVPKVTVLAEASLAPAPKRSRIPPPVEPVLLHFHFPCAPEAGLCWPDGKQGIQDRGAQAPVRATTPTVPGQMPANSPKSGPAQTAPAAPAKP